jgi:Na+/melibiose symporter-like transporter
VNEKAPLRTGILIAYALPAFVVALPTIPVYINLPPLYGIDVGLGLALTGIVLLGARIFDTISDPVVGLLCDRFSFLGGYRKPWIAVGAAIAGIGLFMVLHPPYGADAFYLLFWSVVLYIGWTMVAVPYTAWGAELSGDYDERTRITSWREAFGLLGILGAGALAAVTTALGGDERESLHVITVAAIAFGLLALPLMLWYVPEVPLRRSRQRQLALPHLARLFSSLLANRPFLRLLSAWFLNGLANGIPAALFFVYLEFGLGSDDEQRNYFVLAYFLSAVLSIPLWQVLSRRFGKHRVWCGAMIAACLAFATVPWIAVGSFSAFGLVCVITGMALGADLALPPAMQADVIDYGALRDRAVRTGLYFSLWGMSTKLSLALAVGLALPAIEYLGFDPEAPTESGRQALAVIYALLPVVIKVAAIAVIWRFPLTARKQRIVRRKLDRMCLQSADGKEKT